MKHGVLFVLVVAAASGCAKSDDDRPIGTGGPPGGNGGGGGDGDGGGTIDGGTTTTTPRVCLATSIATFTNPFDTNKCSGSGVTGYTLKLDSDTTAIDLGGDGTFALPTDIEFNPGQYWHVTASNATPSLIPVIRGQYTLPVIESADYTMLLNTAAAVAPDGGAVFVHVVDAAGKPVTGVAATAVPAGVGVFYDNGAAWDGTAGAKTSSQGTVFVPNIAGSAVTITLSKSPDTIQLSNITIANGTNTYVVAVMN